MKRGMAFIGISIGLTVFSVSSFANSLRDTVELTLNNNPDIIAERKNQEAYRMYVDDREGLYLPTIDFESYLETAKIDKDFDDTTPDVNTSEDGYNAAIIFRQYLYDGGETPSQVSEMKHQNFANKFRSLYAIENTILDSVRVYNDLVKFDERIVLSQSMLQVHEDNLITAKEKEEISGEVLETYQVSSKLHFVTDSYIEEQDLKDTGIANYVKFVGSEPKGNVCRPTIDESKVPETLKEAIEIGILRNYKIQEEIERIKQQREKIAQYDSKFLPNLNLELKASIDDDLELNENGTQKDAYARLNLNWNLYNGNRDSIRSEQEMIFLQERKKTLENITNEVVADVKSTYNKYFKYKKRVEALTKYVEANVNIVEAYRNEFEAGTRTFVDILDAESELYNSSKSLINMEYAALNNYYDLMFNLSMLTDTILSNPNQDCANIKPRVIDYSPKKQDKETESQLNGLISTSDSKLIRKELGLDTTAVVDSMDKDIAKKASSDAMKMATSEYKSFLEAPKNFFTINIATKNGMVDASNFIKENNLGDNAYAFEFGPSMKSAKVLYGVYSSVKEAKEALKLLSPSILSGKPYVDNISKHQALYAKYN